MWIGLGRLRTRNSPVAPGEVLEPFLRTLAVRVKHNELTNAQQDVCVCVCKYTMTWSSETT